jgi:hypothetical protein
MTNRPQLQFVTDLYSASFYQRLWQRDLKLARHLCHGVIIALIKDSVKDSALIRGDGLRGPVESDDSTEIPTSWNVGTNEPLPRVNDCQLDVGGSAPRGFLELATLASPHPYK